jgi:hypothetical protein
MGGPVGMLLIKNRDTRGRDETTKKEVAEGQEAQTSPKWGIK